MGNTYLSPPSLTSSVTDQAIRERALARDDHTCRRCERAADVDSAELRLYAIDEPESTAHVSSLVTVCSACADALTTDSSPIAPEREALFAAVRRTTDREGVTVSAVAAFASLTCGLPTRIATTGDPEPETVREEYCSARQGVHLAIDSVDADLAALHAVDDAALEPAVADPLAAYRGTLTELQSNLRGIVALGETVPAGLERCRGCFEPLEAQPCPRCGLGHRDVSQWGDEDGALDHERVVRAINVTLEEASKTTERLTEHAVAVAEQLRPVDE